MDITKSFFNLRDHEGYVGKEDHNKKLEITLFDDKGEVEDTGLCEGILSPIPGGPFSALTPSMWPQDILVKLNQPEDSNSQPEYRFDEFGFRVEEEDEPEQSSNKLLGVSFVEDPHHR